MRKPIEPIYQSIGENIRTLRIAHHMSQSTLAKEIGFRHAISISCIETGKLRIHLSMLLKIASFFHVSPMELLQEPLTSTTMSEMLPAHSHSSPDTPTFSVKNE